MDKHQLDFDPKKILSSIITAQGVQTTPEFGLTRPIPVINLDLSKNPSFRTYLETHSRFEGEGDVNFYWLKFKKHSSFITLIIDVRANVRAFAKIKFHKLKNIGTLEALFAAEAIGIQSGKVGSPITNNIAPKVIMSIPDLGSFQLWRPHGIAALSKELRKSGHAKRRNAHTMAIEILDKRRELFFCRDSSEYIQALFENPDHVSRLNSIAVMNFSDDT